MICRPERELYDTNGNSYKANKQGKLVIGNLHPGCCLTLYTNRREEFERSRNRKNSSVGRLDHMKIEIVNYLGELFGI